LDGECRIISYNTRRHYWYRDSYRYEMSIAARGNMELILKGDWEKGTWEMNNSEYWFRVTQMHIIRRLPNGKPPREAVLEYRDFERSYARVGQGCSLEAKEDGKPRTP